MKTFTLSELNRKAGDITDAALVEPVALTKHGKEKLVMMNAEFYQKLLRQTEVVKAYRVDEAPQDMHDDLMRGLDDILAPDDGADV